MKIFVFVVIVASAISFSEGALTQEQLEAAKKRIVDCGAKEGASKADVQEILENKIPSTHGGQCIAACVGELTGVIKNRKLDVEAAVAEAIKIDPSSADFIREMGVRCAHVTDDDRCVAAVKIYQCGHEKAADAKGKK